MKEFSYGAQPEGARDEASAAAAVREMFDRIAPRYDLANHLLSLNIDRWWWRRAARSFRGILTRPEAQVLDVCCGTGLMTQALLKLRPKDARPVLAVDFSRTMLLQGAKRLMADGAMLVEADALRLPLADASLDLVTTAFGFRNLANYDAGLKEFHRGLKPGGALGILEFGEPTGAIGAIYSFYFHRMLPHIAATISGAGDSYRYLPLSVGRFPPPEHILEAMQSAGFGNVSWTPYNFGIAGLYQGFAIRADLPSGSRPMRGDE